VEFPVESPPEPATWCLASLLRDRRDVELHELLLFGPHEGLTATRYRCAASRPDDEQRRDLLRQPRRWPCRNPGEPLSSRELDQKLLHRQPLRLRRNEDLGVVCMALGKTAHSDVAKAN
jgi:hypothetical protein